jgi:putative flippase GtrA
MKTALIKSKTHIQFVGYAVVAGIGLIADFGSVIVFKQYVGLNYLVAVCIGFIIGLIITYFLSNKYIFGTPKSDPKTLFILFGIIGLVGLGILSVLEWIFTSKLGINYLVSKALATIFVFIWNFLARKKLYKEADTELPYEL